MRLARVVGLREAGRVLRDFATYLPTQAIPALAGFLVLPVLARQLAPTELGVLAIAQTLITFGWTLVASWLAASITRELPAAQATGSLVAFERTLRRGVAAVAGGMVLFAALVAAGAGASDAIRGNYGLVVAATAGLIVQNIAVSLFAAGLRPKAYALVETSARVGGIGIGVGLVFAGYGSAGYLAGLACSSAVIGTIGLVAAWPRRDARAAAAAAVPAPAAAPAPAAVAAPPAARRRLHIPPSLRPWLAYGIPASAASVAGWALSFVDRYILAGLRDTGAVGVYTVGNVLGDRVIMVPMFAFSMAATPLLITAFERHGRVEVERLMRVYTRIILLVGLPSIAYVAAVGGDVVTLVTGYRYYEYAPAAAVAPIVAVGSLLFGLAWLAHTGLAVAKQTKYMIGASVIGVVVNVAANFALIPPLGIKGAAIATPLGTAAYLAATYWWARAHATWHFPVATLLRTAAACGAGYAVVVALPSTGSRAGDVLIAAAAGGAAYVAGLAVLGERRGFAIRSS